MSKRLLTLVLATLMVGPVFVTPASAKPNTEKEAQLVAKVKAGIARLGTGLSARMTSGYSEN